jgi:hypothetical protein
MDLVKAQDIGVRAVADQRAHHCAVAAYHGSWQRPDSGVADGVLTTAAKGDAPDFEMPAGTRNDTTPAAIGLKWVRWQAQKVRRSDVAARCLRGLARSYDNIGGTPVPAGKWGTTTMPGPGMAGCLGI